MLKALSFSVIHKTTPVPLLSGGFVNNIKYSCKLLIERGYIGILVNLKLRLTLLTLISVRLIKF